MDTIAVGQMSEDKDLLRFVTAGSVDDGKSTLIGRLLYEAKGVYEDQLAAIEDRSGKGDSTQGEPDLALLTDGLKAEREQGITIDVAYRYFSTPRRKFIIADSPGHEQYTRNMVTGASTASLAVVLIDATRGVVTQSKRHAFLLALLGIPHFVVAVNKMDLVGYSQAVFQTIREEFTDFAAKLEISDLTFIPVSALRGDNVLERSDNSPWYRGSPLLNHLETVHIASDRNLIDLRLPVQMALRPGPDFRGYLGTVASGAVRPGDEVLALPSGTRTRVKTVFGPDGDLAEAYPPLAAGVTLADEIDLSRGDMLVHVHNVPRVGRTLDAMVVWMAAEPMRPGKTYRIKHTTTMVSGAVTTLRYRVDVNTLHRGRADALALNEIGRCVWTLHRPIAHDPYPRNHATGSFIVIDPITHNTVGAGMILDREPNELAPTPGQAAGEPRSRHVHAHASRVSAQERSARLGQRPVTLWLTGLSGSGKSTIAYGLERRLFDAGYHGIVLDGENARLGLSRDLAFSADDRQENVRRVAEVARWLNDAGLICVCALVSPYARGRQAARRIVGEERFLEVYLSAPVAVCRRRHGSQGLYGLADRGEVPLFTGVTAPYEPPSAADLTLPTHEWSAAECISRLLDCLASRGLIEEV